MMLPITFFVLGLGMLYIGGEGFVRGAAAIGVRFHLSPVVIGLTLVAFATSAPELAISVGAALNDLPGLAVGNVIGSNICNLALIFGLIALVKPAPVRDSIVRRDVLVMTITTLLVPALLLDGRLDRIEGALLVLCIVVYTTLTIWHTRRHRIRHDSSVPVITESVAINLLLSAGSLGLLIYGSDMFVGASVEIATAIGVPAAVVGLSAAALGSSLPELTAAIISARHGHPEMSAGNLIGSNIFNLLLILGLTSTIRPLQSNAVTRIDYAVMIGVTALALTVMLTKATVQRREGAVLVGVYVLYITWLYIQ